jgi:aerobic carbon-monoxide dehydrogenase medium subunit
MSALRQIHSPGSVQDAVRLLGGSGDVRCLAGGATLVAMMNAGIAEPTELVSLAGIEELRGISSLSDGSLRIGAMTRHRETAADARLSGTLAVVRAAANRIANPPVRNMGTMGGSVAFADPAADYLPALAAASAEMEIVGPEGSRRVAAKDFFVDWYTTALQPGELLVAIHLPPPLDGVGLYDKLARVSGDFAIVSVALSVARVKGSCTRVGLAIGGCGPKPVRDDDVDRMLMETDLGDDAVRRAGALLAEAADPVDDVRASAAYRRLAIPRMVGRIVARAKDELRTAA